MKRWILLPVLALVAVAAFAPAHAIPSNPADPTCTLAHTTGDECQGPDHGPVGNVVRTALGFVLTGGGTDPVPPAPDRCRIGVWVGKVTCSSLLPPDGTGTTAGGHVLAFNDPGETATLTVRFIDEVTGAVLKEDTKSSDAILTTPVGPVTFVMIPYSSVYGDSADHPVTIEAEGTHAELGVQTAAVAAFDVYGYDPSGNINPNEPNNSISVSIN